MYVIKWSSAVVPEQINVPFRYKLRNVRYNASIVAYQIDNGRSPQKSNPSVVSKNSPQPNESTPQVPARNLPLRANFCGWWSGVPNLHRAASSSRYPSPTCGNPCPVTLPPPFSRFLLRLHVHDQEFSRSTTVPSRRNRESFPRGKGG